jgi:hypothetical protein
MPPRKPASTAPSAGSWNLTVRNDYPKALHGALLIRVGVEQTRAFWARHPLSRNAKALTASELAEHVGNETAVSPLDWTMGLVNAIEPFLLERGIDLASFAETTRRFANHGSWIQSRHLMKWLRPILAPMFRLGDPHRLILRGASLISKRMSRGVDFRMVRWREAPPVDVGQRTGSIWVSYPGLMEGRIPAWDFAMLPGLDMLVAPRIFGVSPFDSLVVVCDARTVESVPWEVACHRSGDRFTIDGVTHGRCLRLGKFIADSGYDFGELRTSEVEVVAIDRDYHCPWRARTVLSAGCAYGTPGYLVRFTWSSGEIDRKSLRAMPDADLAEEAQATQAVFDDLQRDYLRAIAGA